jgi:hypothetical protein
MSEKTMMIYSSDWQGEKSFRMLPVHEDCPFNEVIFDPKQRVLAIISKDAKEKPQMLPKLNGNGQMIKIKGLSPAEAESPYHPNYVEERVMMDTYYEYYMDNMDDIHAFVTLMAVNADHDAFIHATNPATPA